MSFNHSPKIVTDGLVLCLDGTDPKSNNSISWSDRTGNHTTNFTDTPTALPNGYNFTSSSKIVTNRSVETMGDVFTICSFCQVNTLGTQSSGTNRLVSADRVSNSTKWCLATNLSYQMQFCGQGAIDRPVSQSFRFELGELFFVAVSYNNGLVNLYKNGQKIVNSVSILAGAEYFGNVSIAGRSTSIDRPWNNPIYTMQFYNRILTDSEILQNYNATKGRYGL
jgi:hypothetical protein